MYMFLVIIWRTWWTNVNYQRERERERERQRERERERDRAIILFYSLEH
jgi:hypothetical protein